ncbi:MAG: hypothetical protein R6V03_04105 [Kiritimatiellia bacterium]
MKRTAFLMLVIGLLGTTAVLAGDDFEDPEGGAKKKEKREKKPKQPLEQLELTGVLRKTEKQNKKGKVAVTYTLETEDGCSVRLPKVQAPKKKKGDQEAPPAVDLDACVGERVVVKGRGRETERKGKKIIHLMKIDSVEQVQAAAEPLEEEPEEEEEAEEIEEPLELEEEF